MSKKRTLNKLGYIDLLYRLKSQQRDVPKYSIHKKDYKEALNWAIPILESYRKQGT